MSKYIERITGTIPHTHKTVDIELGGKNLIVTGGNGSGKTSFLLDAYGKINLLIAQKQQTDLPRMKQELQSYEEELVKAIKGTASFDTWKSGVERVKKQIEPIEKGLNILIPNNVEFSSNYDDKKAIIQYFEDKRLVDITEAKSPEGLSTAKQNAQSMVNKNLGSKLEQHLVNLKTRHALAIATDNDQNLADTIDQWFIHFEQNLQILFEDKSVKMRFNSTSYKFTLQQDNKPGFTFQTLSAGYRAIFDIYADLLMRTEYFDISPTDLQGVVFIDEIDAHLHVSLQRLILPFFISSFPQLQFIVTTHSPFVLMSTRETLVFDLDKEVPYIVSEVKSQNEVLNDLLGVPVAMPIWVEQSLNRILDKYLANTGAISLEALKQELVNAGLEEYFPETVAKVLEAN